MESGIEEYIRKAYGELETSNIGAAMTALREALKVDYEHPEVIYALKCLNWWGERVERFADFQPYERGAFILSQWRAFYTFADRIGTPYEGCLYALKRFVFSQALEAFREILEEGQKDPGLLLQIGRCYKGAGNFEEALNHLIQAVNLKLEDGAALAELADVHALLGDIRAAKVLFREAFFLDPQGIDLRSMESEMITRLVEKVRERGFEGPELAEWIPVYGCILGVFSVKRELKPVELGRLNESILSLENEFQSVSFQGRSFQSPLLVGAVPDLRAGRPLLLKPRLINRYFWLIDYYVNTGADPRLVEEIMLKIKIVDPVIYEQYRT